jgi:LmbE family N-acetylglucosaminyl deacetylase
MAQRLTELPWQERMTALVLAPHPDDFDAIALTLRWLHERGHALHLAVLTTGASGVDDGDGDAHTNSAKAELREQEQRASCRFFGLAESRLSFLRLWGDAALQTQDAECLRAQVLALRPDLVFMPHGNDSNATHRRTYQSFRALAAQERLNLHACLNQDAKTQGMRSDLVMPFGPADAQWKAELLRHHGSQQQRNLRMRGIGFDERVLQLNRDAAASVGLEQPFAEVFELERYVDGEPRPGWA